ncbi:hypothetical protein CC80DRAFT_506612 [Byssothecium circinans]|uniref:Uncharacterized protein n=1 Tax=Byssothecium circinans TaxID=147558 RepID=A0A6A5TNA8_9PLEO|nr:hypothetical protein CC80DRAFT_506612 [Byssothecium circinans]
MAEATANLLTLAAELSAYSNTLHEISASLDTIAKSLESEAADIAEERARLIKLAEDAAKANRVNVDVNVGVRVRGGSAIGTRHPGCGACQSNGTEPPAPPPQAPPSPALTQAALTQIGRPAASEAGSKVSSKSGSGGGWGTGNTAQASFNVNWGSPIGKK